MEHGVIWIELNGPLEFPFRSGEIPVVKFLESCQCMVSACEIWVESERLLQRACHNRNLFGGGPNVGYVGPRQRHIGAGKLRIDPRRLLEVLRCLEPCVLTKSSGVAVILTLQIGFQRSWIDRMGISHAHLFARRHLYPDFIGDRSRDGTLQDQNIPKVAIIGLRPEIGVSWRVD